MAQQTSWTRKAAELATTAMFWITAIAVFISAMSTEAIDNGFVAFLAISAMSFIATFVHEIGHAAVANRRGAQINMIAVLPFAFAPPTRKFSIMRERRGGDIAGFVSYNFPDDCGTRRDEMAIAAAGPVWNLVCAGLLILALVVTAPHSPPTSPMTSLEPAIVAYEEGEPRSMGSPVPLPTQEVLERPIEREKARLRAQWWLDWIESLIQVLIAVSIASGFLNLLPYRGSDGAIILEHWRWLRGKA
ncbi:MAG: M50 family metallopeptidase [Pseudomonadota bacterium]